MGGSDGGVGGWVGQFWVGLLRFWVGSNKVWVGFCGSWLVAACRRGGGCGGGCGFFFFFLIKGRNFLCYFNRWFGNVRDVM